MYATSNVMFELRRGPATEGFCAAPWHRAMELVAWDRRTAEDLSALRMEHGFCARMETHCGLSGEQAIRDAEFWHWAGSFEPVAAC